MRMPAAARGLRAVVAQGLSGKGFLWLGAFTLGFFPPLAALLPTAQAHDPEVLRESLAALLMCLVAAGTLLTAGAPGLSADYRSGAIAFFLARPLRPAVIWLGRLCTGLLTAGAAAMLVVLPTALLGGRPWEALAEIVLSETTAFGQAWFSPAEIRLGGFDFPVPPWLPLLVVAALILPAVGHLVGVVFRLRSLWTLGDIVFWVVAGLAIYQFWGRFQELETGPSLLRLVAGAALGTVLAAGLGGWAQLRWGGTDPGRAHAVQSLLLYGFLGLSLLPAAHEVRRLENLGPSDLDVLLPGLLPAPTGPWMLVRGLETRSGYAPIFAWNADTRESVRLAHRFIGSDLPTFSPDGRGLFWHRCGRAESRDGDRPCTDTWVDLAPEVTGPRVWQREVEVGAEDARAFVYSSFTLDGGGLVAGGGRRLALYRLPLGSPVRTWTLPEGHSLQNLWAGSPDDEPRIFLESEVGRPSDGGERIVFELDPESDSPPRELIRMTAASGRLDPGFWYRTRCPDASPSTCFVHGLTGRSFSSSGIEAPLPRALDDGRLLLVGRPFRALGAPKTGSRWSLLDPDSGEAETFETPPVELLGGEPRAGLVTAGRLSAPTSRKPIRLNPWQSLWGPPGSWQTLVVDVERGIVVHELQGYLPFQCWGAASCTGSSAGAPGSDWVVDAAGFPHRLDPTDGTVSPLGLGASGGPR